MEFFRRVINQEKKIGIYLNSYIAQKYKANNMKFRSIYLNKKKKIYITLLFYFI